MGKHPSLFHKSFRHRPCLHLWPPKSSLARLAELGAQSSMHSSMAARSLCPHRTLPNFSFSFPCVLPINSCPVMEGAEAAAAPEVAAEQEPACEAVQPAEAQDAAGAAAGDSKEEAGQQEDPVMKDADAGLAQQADAGLEVAEGSEEKKAEVKVDEGAVEPPPKEGGSKEKKRERSRSRSRSRKDHKRRSRSRSRRRRSRLACALDHARPVIMVPSCRSAIINSAGAPQIYRLVAS
jgi:hypothetical protein